MAPDWEQGRYITLLGDPIGPDGKPEPLRTSFYKAADFKAAGVATALMAVMGEVSGAPLDVTILVTSVVAVFNLASRTGIRFLEKEYALTGHFGFTKEDLQIKCIDTRPTRNTPSTSSEHKQSAIKAKVSYSVWGGALVIGLSIPPYYVAASLAFLTIGARMVSGYHRFNQVTNDNWVIVDMPKPRKVEATVREGESHLVPVAF